MTKCPAMRCSPKIHHSALNPTLRRLAAASLCALLGLGTLLPTRAAPAAPAVAPSSADASILDAREAFRKKEKSSLAVARLASAGHPLAQWAEYWELTSRLATTPIDEVEAFYQRWPGSYVEDRLRNDWLLELGRRRDWPALLRDHPRFRMNDDREVTCYVLLARHLAGLDVRDAARTQWLAQRELDDGCHQLASTLMAAGVFQAADAWAKARLSVEWNRPRSARAAVELIDPSLAQNVADALDKPARWLAGPGPALRGHGAELATLALMRLAATELDAATLQLQQGLAQRLPRPLAAVAWAALGKQAALKLQPGAVAHYGQALALRAQLSPAQRAATAWSDETLAWLVRAALRADAGTAERWALVETAIAAMSEAEQVDSAWVYWRARAALARAAPGEEGEAARSAARALLESISQQLNFYGKLAGEDLGRAIKLPAAPLALNPAERDAAQAHPGLTRALQLINLGLRGEGVREWNYSLRGMTDRELLAAAQRACDAQVWDRCINTSERTRVEVDMAQRYPTPMRRDVLAKAREIGLDPAYVYGLIRQESRFIIDVRSSVGASGLMQLMPATARWTAKRIGLPYSADMISEPDTNLRLGTAYLKLVLDDFDGSQALAAAAYNAGPSRSRRWREGPVLEPAVWAENIPFNETRDYVKKVLSNAVYYSHVLGTRVPGLRPRLGAHIGPRDPGAAPPNPDLP